MNANDSPRSAPAEAPVEIVAYDPSWPAAFTSEAERLHAALGRWLAGPIEHIGSTAVHGLAAKPVIDIMAGVDTLDVSRPAIEAAAGLNYCYYPYRPDTMHWFCKPSAAFRTHHLHLVPIRSAQWRRVLAFRDYLRATPEVAAEYEGLKRTLAAAHRFDREAYTAAKEPFIAAVTGRALRDGFGGASVS